MNVASYSIGKPFCDPALTEALAVSSASHHTTSPSAIVVMMNANSSQNQSNMKYQQIQSQSHSYHSSHQEQIGNIQSEFNQQLSFRTKNSESLHNAPVTFATDKVASRYVLNIIDLLYSNFFVHVQF